MTLVRLSVLRQTIALMFILVCGGSMAAQSRTPVPEPSMPMTRRQPVPPLSRQITIRLDSVSVQDAIDVIAREARLQISYKPDALPQGRRISLRLNAVTAKDAFEQVLKAYDFDIRTVDDSNFVVVKRSREQKSSADDVQQDSGRVRGRVVDSTTGKGVAGVIVTVGETKLSAKTSESGEYTIANVPTGVHSISGRLIGYRVASKSVTVVANRTVTANFALSGRSVVLSEVVTSITGEQRKIEIGNDVTTIKVDSVLRTAPITTVTDLLEGRVPGLTVLRSSGVPGAPSRLRLRGLGGGLLPNEPGAPTNDPIVIVDGIRIDAAQSGKGDQSLLEGSGLRLDPTKSATAVPIHERASAIDQIDPNSIDKIDVYKGPSATALYGSDAANGVIVITTKRGRAGPVRWTMVGYQAVEYLAGSYAAPGYYPFFYGSSTPGAIRPGITVILDSVVRFQALDDPQLSPFGRGNETGGSATVSGGTGILTYSITGSTRRSLGLLKVPNFYRDLFQQALDSSPPNWMRRPNTYTSQGLDVNVSAEWSKNLRATLSTKVTGSNQWQSAAQDRISDLAGQYIDTLNPDATKLGEYVTRNNAKQLTSNLALNLDWTRWRVLPLKAIAGISRLNQDEVTRIPRGIPIGSQTTLGGYATGTGVSNMRTGQLNGMLFPGRRVSVTAGTQVIKNERRKLQGGVDSLPLGVVTPSTLSIASQQHTSNISGGWYLEPRLNLNSRFFINPGFRLDGGNASGKNSGLRGGLFSLFPKLNQSWLVINRDDGDPMFGAITSLRIRGALGIAGVQPQAFWQYRMMRSPQNNDLGTDGLEVSTLGNTQLHPERTRELEGGFDLDLWNGRMMLTVTQYRKVRIDAIVPFTVAPSVYGSKNIYYNIGRVQNTGTELTASVIPIDNRNIMWSLTASLSKHSNKLTSLNDGLNAIEVGNGTRLVPGYPLFGRWEFPILGNSTVPGNRLSIKDVVVGDSAIYMGAQIPNFDLPIHTQLSLFQGSVSVNASFSYNDGLTQLNSGNSRLLANLYLNPQATLADQAAALMARSSCTGFKCTDYGLIQTVNSLRFQSFSLGYNVPRQLAKRLGASSLSFAVQGSNLGLWTNYRGKDPNVSSTFSDIVIDSGQLPEPRTWRVQCRVGN